MVSQRTSILRDAYSRTVDSSCHSFRYVFCCGECLLTALSSLCSPRLTFCVRACGLLRVCSESRAEACADVDSASSRLAALRGHFNVCARFRAGLLRILSSLFPIYPTPDLFRSLAVSALARKVALLYPPPPFFPSHHPARLMLSLSLLPRPQPPPQNRLSDLPPSQSTAIVSGRP